MSKINKRIGVKESIIAKYEVFFAKLVHNLVFFISQNWFKELNNSCNFVSY